jgi:dihydrofolate reductase
MARVIVFENTTLDGYFSDEKGDIRWFKQDDDPEFKAYTEENASGGGTLLLGRKTYELMKSYWPTPAAKKADPDLAQKMNELPKVVFSRTLKDSDAEWENVTIAEEGVAETVRKLKEEKGPDMTVLGSGSVVSQLTDEGLVDEYQFVVNPIVLGQGKTPFDETRDKAPMKLTRTRAFKNGKVLLCYEPGA